MRHIRYSLALFMLCVPSLLAADQYYSALDTKTNKTIDCSYNNRKVEAGTLKGNPPRFRALSIPIDALKKKIERSSKKAILKKQLKTLQAEYARLVKLCKNNLPVFPAPTPTPSPTTPSGGSTPVATATPNRQSTPTPTPTSSGCTSGCYDSSRNTSCFNIPAPTLGNETRGAQLWAGNCAGCHTESSRRNRVYGQIRLALRSIPEMLPFSDDYSTQDIADLVAYLNRFNSKQCRTDWP